MAIAVPVEMEPALAPLIPRIPGMKAAGMCYRYIEGEWLTAEAAVVAESPLTIHVNGEELLTVFCTPTKLDCLVIGLLYLENIIAGTGELVTLHICRDELMADVWLADSKKLLPTQRAFRAGCASGLGFLTDPLAVSPVVSTARVTPAQVLSLVRQLQESAQLYRLCGGVHTSALSDGERLLVVAEDVGRHNTLNKIQGECLLKGIETQGKIVLTTGRISSEMLLKAAKMACPIVVSHSSPTSLAVELAERFGITLVGYARAGRFSVHTEAWRVAGRRLDSRHGESPSETGEKPDSRSL